MICWIFVGFQFLIAVIMDVVIFWDIVPCSPHVNQRFRGTYHLHLQGHYEPSKKSACSSWFIYGLDGVIDSLYVMTHALYTVKHYPSISTFEQRNYLIHIPIVFIAFF
jgi:hypothetical protein